MNCKVILKKYLEDNKFDGLYDEYECGCKNDDLMPCGEYCGDCRPGYIHLTEDSEYDFFIKPERESIDKVKEKY